MGTVHAALETLIRTHAWKIRHLGADNALTLQTAVHLADAQGISGMFAESIALRRRTLIGLRRTRGETYWQTLECEILLAHTLVIQNDLDEAREIRTRLLPVVSRIFGPDHFLMEGLNKIRA